MQDVAQRAIVRTYKRDIARYDRDDKLYLDEVFDLIPSCGVSFEATRENNVGKKEEKSYFCVGKKNRKAENQ